MKGRGARVYREGTVVSPWEKFAWHQAIWEGLVLNEVGQNGMAVSLLCAGPIIRGLYKVTVVLLSVELVQGDVYSYLRLLR